MSSDKAEKIKVLIAEDDKLIANAFYRSLTKAGFNIVLATDGVETIDLARTEKPDIILLDLIMPKKNGFEVLEEMKKDEDLKSIVVIVLSNLEDDQSVLKTSGYGIAEYLLKSNFSIEKVVEKIKQHIKQ